MDIVHDSYLTSCTKARCNKCSSIAVPGTEFVSFVSVVIDVTQKLIRNYKTEMSKKRLSTAEYI